MKASSDMYLTSPPKIILFGKVIYGATKRLPSDGFTHLVLFIGHSFQRLRHLEWCDFLRGAPRIK